MPPIAGMPAAIVPAAVHFGVFWKVRMSETSVPVGPMKRLYLASMKPTDPLKRTLEPAPTKPRASAAIASASNPWRRALAAMGVMPPKPCTPPTTHPPETGHRTHFDSPHTHHNPDGNGP